jgi:hypothetical protein
VKRPAIRQQDGFLNDCARILLLHALHSSDRGPRQTSTLVDLYSSLEGKTMATLDEITNEKQRVSEALARVDAQRERLAGQLAELEATERVLARYSKGSGVRRTASARTANAARKAASPARAGARPRTATTKSAGRKRSSPRLNDQVLALADGKTQPEIAAACKGARPNHVGAAIARHRRAGRIEERDGKLYAAQPTRTGQSAAV